MSFIQYREILIGVKFAAYYATVGIMTHKQACTHDDPYHITDSLYSFYSTLQTAARIPTVHSRARLAITDENAWAVEWRRDQDGDLVSIKSLPCIIYQNSTSYKHGKQQQNKNQQKQ